MFLYLVVIYIELLFGKKWYWKIFNFKNVRKYYLIFIDFLFGYIVSLFLLVVGGFIFVLFLYLDVFVKGLFFYL